MSICFYFKIKYFGKGCQMSQMIILNFTNSYKFISLDLEHYFKSYKRKQKKKKEKEKYLTVGPLMTSPSLTSRPIFPAVTTSPRSPPSMRIWPP